MTFKKLLVLIFLPVGSLLAQSRYTIKMDLTGFKDSTMVQLVNLDLEQVIDSARIHDGKVEFTGTVQQPVAGRIHTVDNKYIVVYLENKVINIKGSYTDFQYAKIEGSEINNFWTKSRDFQKGLTIERDSLMQKYFKLNDADSLIVKEIGKRVKQIDSVVLKYRTLFIKTEPATYFTMVELFFLRNDLQRDSLAAMYKAFPASLKKSKEAAVVEAYIKSNKPAVGAKFTDIEGADVADKTHKISDLKGKYILLEFWASWCGPCRQENPTVVVTYNKYHPKGFEIFGFSTDANKDSWIKAIKQDGLTWLNVSDLKGFYSRGAASYQVRGIPQNFLIDPGGTIIAKDLRGNALAEKLKEIYKE